MIREALLLLLLSCFSHVRLCATPRTAAYQAPLSMEFSRQKYWSGLPFPSPGDIPNPGIEPRTPALQADALPSEPPGKPPRNYMLLLLSCFSCVRLCATPETAAHQAPPSLGFSRQEHWSGLPFPSPMHERKSESEVTHSCPTLATPWTAAYQTPLSMGFSRQEYWSGVPLPSPLSSAT